MIKIIKLHIEEPYRLHVLFDDGVEKIIDGTQFIGNDPFTQPLSDPAYFQRVNVYDNGRGIYWPNEYDICPDNLRYHIQAIDTRQYSSPQLSSQVA